jgi:hypothetical protein
LTISYISRGPSSIRWFESSSADELPAASKRGRRDELIIDDLKELKAMAGKTRRDGEDDVEARG